ncbi:hypothetical protein [Chitinilyticum aquatile]|uniref:hypothetical protein n=1 Tax=Chitinilyticum aquatile TaxID=362520 RepID=UPI000413AD96|nr:hypothetical protein [Chitinilyticum aquatile]
MPKQKILIVESCLIEGQHVEAGETVELDEATAHALIASRRGVAAPEAPAEPEPAPDKKAK